MDQVGTIHRSFCGISGGPENALSHFVTTMKLSRQDKEAVIARACMAMANDFKKQNLLRLSTAARLYELTLKCHGPHLDFQNN